MPKRRPPNEVWQEVRRIMWARDGGFCQYPDGKHPVALEETHIDHVVSGKRGINRLADLCTLCRYHHVLRGRGAAGEDAAMLRDMGAFRRSRSPLLALSIAARRRVCAPPWPSARSSRSQRSGQHAVEPQAAT